MSLARVLIQPLQGWALRGVTQGRRCANPGLYDGNPFRVAREMRELRSRLSDEVTDDGRQYAQKNDGSGDHGGDFQDGPHGFVIWKTSSLGDFNFLPVADWSSAVERSLCRVF